MKYKLLLVICLFTPNLVLGQVLKAAIQRAETMDPAVKSAAANLEAFSYGIDIAKSRLMPQVSAAGTFQKTNQSYERLGVTTSNSVNATNAQVVLRQSIFRMRDWAGLKIGDLQYEAAQQKVVATYSDLWERVSAAWFDVIAASEYVKSYESALTSVSEYAVQAKKSYQAGVSTKEAWKEAEAQKELLASKLSDARLNLTAKINIFRNLTGDYFEFRDYSKPLSATITKLIKSREELFTNILTSNPDLMIAKLTEAIREQQLRQAKFDHYPTVDLIASSTKTNNDNVNQIGYKVTSNAVGVQVSVPLFTGGGLTAQELQAASFFAVAKSDVLLTEQKLKNQFEVDYASYEALFEKIKASELLAQSSQEQLKSAMMGLKAGIRTWADVGNIRINLANREAEHVANISTLLRVQLRIMSLLPITDAVWDGWVFSFEKSCRVK